MTRSLTDRLILESYKSTMEGLAAYFGEAFEFVLHDLTDLDHSIIKIKNGSHSSRGEGAPITDLALSMLEEIRKKGQAKKPYMVYVSQSKYGKPVRSTTIVIYGPSGQSPSGQKKRAIGLLCINLYLDSPLSALLESFSLVPQKDYVTENFINDSDELIKKSLEKVKAGVLEDPKVSISQKNKEIITILYYQGIFKLKNAVQIIAGDLKLSKNTVYLHIRSLEEKIGSQ
jgi:predicted transcriptional regulator YheO